MIPIDTQVSRHCKQGQGQTLKMLSSCAGEFAAQPEDVSCFSSDLHYAYFHCIPSNTSFLSIDWYINGTIGENTSSSRQDQMKMKLTCSLLYSNTSIQCVVRYSKTCLYSRNASLYVEGIVVTANRIYSCAYINVVFAPFMTS